MVWFSWVIVYEKVSDRLDPDAKTLDYNEDSSWYAYLCDMLVTKMR